jgi:hypothetical protein
MLDFYKQLSIIKQLSYSLERFTDKGNYLYHFRCPVCGDSKKDPTRTRGNFVKVEDSFVFKCFNCGLVESFPHFLKEHFPDVYKQEILAEFLHKEDSEEKVEEIKQELLAQKRIKRLTKIKKSSLKEIKEESENIITSSLKKISDCSQDNPAREYLEGRGLSFALDKFFYVANVREYRKKLPSYCSQVKDYLTSDAIGIPHYSEDGKEVWFMQMRFLPNAELRTRYLTLRTSEEADEKPKLFGLERVKRKQVISVTEGAFDSMFVDNCIALSGITDWKTAIKYFPLEELRFIPDGDFRSNKQVRKVVRAIINDGHSIVLLPKIYYLNGVKDTNDLYSRLGLSREEINSLYDEHTYQGLEAQEMLARFL